MPISVDPGISKMELALAARNHGMPLEALAYDVTPAGLHYLLIHYDIPQVAVGTWTLTVDGAISRSLVLTMEDIKSLPQVTERVTMECAGNGRARLDPRPIGQPWLNEAVGTAEWTGVRLVEVLMAAGLEDGAIEVLFSGMDRGVEGGYEQPYERSLAIGDASRPEVILAHSMNGQPLLPQHGFPLRLIVPGWYGMTSVKWLHRITVLTEAFQGYQQSHSYRIRIQEEEPGEPVARILPRSLMIPPGVPGYPDRERFVSAGEVTIRGRAWSGFGAITRVEVSVDDGASWFDANVEPATHPYAWQSWHHIWNAAVGSYVLSSRATDATGLVQPLDPVWNLGGYLVNATQSVTVTVNG
ncbi:MAG TPA: sulfite oxidase [Acidimicrobiia bacterium]|nr:sulfite oxidase [Acidimicrobiia bacterium]